MSIISVIVGLISFVLTVCVCWIIRGRQPAFAALENQAKPNVLENYYFPKEGFTYQGLVEATGNFSESAVVGRGACGTVYKAVMGSGEVIAVKKLNLAEKELLLIAASKLRY